MRTLAGQRGNRGCGPPVLWRVQATVSGGAGWSGVEAEGVSALILGEAVVALGAGVGVVGVQACLDRWPPGLDGRGETVHLGCGAGRGMAVEGLEVGSDLALWRVGAEPAGQPDPGRNRGHRFGGRLALVRGLPAAPPPLAPDQPHRRSSVRQIPRLTAHPALHRRGEHPAGRAGRGGLIRGHQVHQAATGVVLLDPLDGEPVQAEQTCRVGSHIGMDRPDMRRLNQARDLTS